MHALKHPPRYATVDALRGFAMVWMTAFHFCFDLNHFGYLQANFYADSFWTLQRAAIVTMFTFCAGLGQAIAVQQGQEWPRFWKRWRQIALCALLVTIGSYAMYPQSFIYFGILHGLALMLIVVRATENWGRWLWPLGAIAIGLPWLAPAAHHAVPALEMFNSPALNWLGLVSRKPVTEDYAPLLPWLGVMWWGMAAGRWCVQTQPQWLGNDSGKTNVSASKPNHPLTNGLAWLGRWSLSYYMLHQPVMIGALSAWVWFSRG
jgi:uncharacterized membrane protein